VLTIKLTAQQARDYGGAVRSKILSAARARARQKGERMFRIVRPNGTLLEQLVVEPSKRSSRRPAARSSRQAGPPLDDGALAAMRRSVDAIGARLRDKQPKLSRSCTYERHFVCDGTVADYGTKCQCPCHKPTI
jgi:hypothetical protein